MNTGKNGKELHQEKLYMKIRENLRTLYCRLQNTERREDEESNSIKKSAKRHKKSESCSLSSGVGGEIKKKEKVNMKENPSGHQHGFESMEHNNERQPMVSHQSVTTPKSVAENWKSGVFEMKTEAMDGLS